MRMKDPVPQFSYIISQLADRHPSLSYLHLVEPRAIGGGEDVIPTEGESLDFASNIWKRTSRPLLVAGGYTPELALEHMRQCGRENDIVVFGRWFISNVSFLFLPGVFFAEHCRGISPTW
jgi:NADPH2 dehydrogenase